MSHDSLRDEALAKAHKEVFDGMSEAVKDPYRPRYHFRPPSGWMNDPNGTCYQDGQYHCFFQHNPSAETWGNLHWGHATSSDGVFWSHRPIGLWPSIENPHDPENIETHCFSGCIWNQGAHATQPKAFYTKVNQSERGPKDFQQWVATAESRDMLTWQKHPENGFIFKAPEGTVSDWRDPYVFEAGGKILCVIGGGTEDEAHVLIYEAQDTDTLAEWEYKGVMCARPRDCYADRTPNPVPRFFFECPNMIHVGGSTWLLLISPFAPVEYIIGDFDVDTLTFTERATGVLDFGVGAHSSGEDPVPNFYATNTIIEPEDVGGRILLLGWLRGFRPGGGWNGALSLPRVLTFAEDGTPRQQPLPELTKLRAFETLSVGGHPDGAHEGMVLDDSEKIPWSTRSQQVEVVVVMQTGTVSKISLELCGGAVTVVYMAADRTVDVCGSITPVQRIGELKLHVFLDRSTLEVFVNDGESTATRVVYVDDLSDLMACVRVEGGSATVDALQCWEMMPIWNAEEPAAVAKL